MSEKRCVLIFFFLLDWYKIDQSLALATQHLALKLNRNKKAGVFHHSCIILYSRIYRTGEPSDIVENEVFSTESAPIELGSHRSLSLS